MQSSLQSHAVSAAIAVIATLALAANASAQMANSCAGLPDSPTLKTALASVVYTGAGGTSATKNGGLDFPMWAVTVNRYGVVCSVATTGTVIDDAWLNSRVIAAQKAYTANGFSRPLFALSSANLFAPTQNNGSLNGLQFSNPVDPRVVYRGDPTLYGTVTDPMVGLKPGGINVFGGGLGLYTATDKLGAVGVSGDTSCADHNIAWKLRHALSTLTGTAGGITVANRVPGGVRSVDGSVGAVQPVPAGAKGDDGLIYPGTTGIPTGFQHASCGNGENAVALPAVTN